MSKQTGSLDLLSVIIPAYNKPDFLYRQLSSIIKQSYRPLEIIVSDDCSPRSLEEVVEKIRLQSDDQVFIKFTRHSSNLGVYWNAAYCQSQITGKYAVLTSHDDWFIDENFFSDAVHALQSQDNCYIAIANAALENVNGKGILMFMMNLYWEPGTPQWSYLNGRSFIVNRLYVDLHPSYSSIVLNYEVLRQSDYFSFFISRSRLLKVAGTSRLNFEPDEAFTCVNLLASQGAVALCGKVVSFRGNPPDSWSKTSFWSRTVGFGLFIPNLYLYRFYRKIDFKEGQKLMLKMLIVSYSIPKLNVIILRYLSFDRDAFFIMMLSVLWFYLSRRGLVQPLMVLSKPFRNAFDQLCAKK